MLDNAHATVVSKEMVDVLGIMQEEWYFLKVWPTGTSTTTQKPKETPKKKNV